HSVILMSIQPNAPYRDRIEDDGGTLIYEGHDAPRRNGGPDPKRVDQPDTSPSGTLTQMVASNRQPPLPKSKPGPRASFGCTRSCGRGYGPTTGLSTCWTPGESMTVFATSSSSSSVPLQTRMVPSSLPNA